MQDLPAFLAYLETNEFFQLELLALLASLILSLSLTSSSPFFTVSALDFLTAAASLLLELFNNPNAAFSYTEVTTTITFATILLATFTHSLVKHCSLPALRCHAATALGFSIYLGIKAYGVWEDMARPIDVNVDRCCLEAAGFSVMHLLSALLVLQDRSTAQQVFELNYDEKISSLA